MRHALAPALLLIFAAFPLPGGSEPLYETPAILTCPECSPINAATQVADGIVAVGQRGLILRSTTNGGWEQQHAPIRRTLNAVIHTGDDRLIAVGQDALVISRDSPGASWTLIQADPTLDAPLLDLWIGNEGRGFAVGAYGLALVTDDGGRNWSVRKIDAKEPHFYAIREALKGHCTSVVSTAPYCSLATAVPAGHRFRWVGMEHFWLPGRAWGPYPCVWPGGHDPGEP